MQFFPSIMLLSLGMQGKEKTAEQIEMEEFNKKVESSLP